MTVSLDLLFPWLCEAVVQGLCRHHVPASPTVKQVPTGPQASKLSGSNFNPKLGEKRNNLNRALVQIFLKQHTGLSSADWSEPFPVPRPQPQAEAAYDPHLVLLLLDPLPEILELLLTEPPSERGSYLDTLGALL